MDYSLTLLKEMGVEWGLEKGLELGSGCVTQKIWNCRNAGKRVGANCRNLRAPVEVVHRD